MKRLLLILTVLFVTVELSSTTADAWIFRRLFRGRRSSVKSQGYTAAQYGTTEYANAVAQDKANRMASINRWRHFGGSMGGGNYEGVGSGATPEQAKNNCCYSSDPNRVIIGEGVAQGSSGRWFACRLYR